MGTRASYKWRSKWPGDGGRPLLSRRALLASAFVSVASAQKAEVSNFDWSLLDEPAVPAELFFIRDHFPAPNVSSAGWKLSVVGAVADRVEISLDDLGTLPRKTLPVTIECAENPVGGGLVSHAIWAGFSLSAVLERSRPTPDARFVRLAGADGFSRAIPIEKALDPNILLATSMNGEKLPVSHGFPLRAVIAGWYGMDSVKWLRKIEVLASETDNTGYERLTRSLLLGTRPAGPVSSMNIKSAFSRPLDGAILTGRRFIIRGAAWAGENRVRRVEVTADGKSWQSARLGSEPQPYSWAQWTYEWRIPVAGQYDLTVRAEDDRGRRQPAERAADRADEYESNAWQTVRVTVL